MRSVIAGAKRTHTISIEVLELSTELEFIREKFGRNGLEDVCVLETEIYRK